MNISINCKLSLSKKIRALLGKEASLTLVSQDIADGKGTAILTLSSDNIGDFKPEEMGETSIMLMPVEIAEESPNVSSPVHATIFSTIPRGSQEEPIVQKIAVVKAPEKGQEARAIKKQAEIPKAFAEVKETAYKKYVKNMEELMAVVNVAKNKISDIDPDMASNEREKLILQVEKEKAEAIDTPAWIVNDQVGMLTLNDLGVSLPLNIPFDLSSISAKKVATSRDLKMLIRDNYVRFISPAGPARS